MRELIIMQLIEKTITSTSEMISEFFGLSPDLPETKSCNYRFTDNEKVQIRKLHNEIPQLNWREFTAVINARYSCDKSIPAVRRICK